MEEAGHPHLDRHAPRLGAADDRGRRHRPRLRRLLDVRPPRNEGVPSAGRGPDASLRSRPQGRQAGRPRAARGPGRTDTEVDVGSSTSPRACSPLADVRTHGTGVKHIRHHIVGDLTLAYESMDLRAEPDLSMTIYAAEPGSPSEDALRLLASWAATHQHTNQPQETDRPHRHLL
ncbi:hypothetical protein [Nonomuraea sp. NPDC049784]|uniref:MmyB family transcriptional regulator n=1 Tax=Nonomuraea sp. NPDC049784 TaxID=3154361 RepID=UPI0033F7D299